MSKIKEENREKDAALSRALSDIEKRFGKGSIMRLGEKGAKVSVESISTGVLPLDLATGVGGMPRGRVVEIYGPESSGKTTIALHVIAQAQKAGGFAAFIDAEHALDPLYAEKLGVNIEELLVSQPDNGEQALEICGALVSSGAVDVIAIDSVAALVPRAEIEGEMGDAHVGLQARLMSQALRKLTSFVHKTNTLVIFINQLREKVGIVYGSPEVTAGGRALKFYSSIRLEVRKSQDIKSGAERIGTRVKMKITKNKVAPPFKQAEVELFYGEGVSEEMCLVDLGEQHQVIEKSGSWYSFGGTRLGQGRENVRQFLKEHPEMTAEIRSRIIEAAMPAKDNVVPFKQAEVEGD